MVGGERARAFGYGVRAQRGSGGAFVSFRAFVFFSFILFQEVWWLGERERGKEEEKEKAEVGVRGERRLILTIV